MAGAAVSAALMLLALGAPAALAAPPSLVAQWRFDEAAGAAAIDDGPFRLDGTLSSSDEPVRIAGSSGGALRFDGSSSVELPASSRLDLQAMSVEAWVRGGASPGRFRYVVARGGRGCWSGSWGLYSAEGGGVAFYVFDGSHYVVSAAARPADVWDGAWHRVDGTFDGQQLRLYVDGRPVGDPMAASLTVDYANTSSRAAIGTYSGSCELPFSGDIDTVRVLSGALSADAVAGLGTPTGEPPADPAPLPAQDPGTVIVAAPPAPPASTAPACTIRLSRASIVVRRRTVVRAKVGVKRVTVTARRGSGKALAKARTNRAGVARLVIRSPSSGRVTVSVTGRQVCAPASLKVLSH